MVITSIKVFTASNISDFKFIISETFQESKEKNPQNIGTTIHPSKRNVKLNVVKHITTMLAQ
jgi:hypothetical protein